MSTHKMSFAPEFIEIVYKEKKKATTRYIEAEPGLQQIKIGDWVEAHATNSNKQEEDFALLVSKNTNCTWQTPKGF